jgi:hypothetical protein
VLLSFIRLKAKSLIRHISAEIRVYLRAVCHGFDKKYPRDEAIKIPKQFSNFTADKNAAVKGDILPRASS